MQRVPHHRYMYRRGDKLIFRRGIPPYARAVFGGRREVQVSLRTAEISQARHTLAIHLGRFEKKLASARNTLAPAEAVDVQWETPSIMDMEEAARRWLSVSIGRWHVDYSAPDQRAAGHAKIKELRLLIDLTRRYLQFGGTPSLNTEWIVDHIANDRRWLLPLDGDAYRAMMRLIGRGQIEFAERQLQELEGQPLTAIDETFAPERYEADEKRKRHRDAMIPVSLIGLFEGYVTENQPSPATIKAWRRIVAAFVTFISHDDASKITGDDVVRWKDHLLAGGGASGERLSAKTVRDKYLACLKAVLGWGRSNSKLLENAAQGLKLRGPKKKVLREERGLTDTEAATILKATLLAPPSRLSKERAAAQRWVPWLCAYTGARVNEITQLRAEDVVRKDQLWTILITPEAGSTKTGTTRSVPLHPHLIEQGFVTFANAKSGYLFFDPGRKRQGSDENPQSKKVGEYLARWVRKIGVNDPNVQPNHGWRHRFKTQARRCRMDPEVRDAIQGHVPRTEGEGYGDNPPEVMLREIELLPRYDFVV